MMNYIIPSQNYTVSISLRGVGVQVQCSDTLESTPIDVREVYFNR